LEIKKPTVREEIEKAISSVKGFSYQRSGDPCDLLILEIDEHFEFEEPWFFPGVLDLFDIGTESDSSLLNPGPEGGD